MDEIQNLLMSRGVGAGDPGARDLVRQELEVEERVLEEFFGDGPLADLLVDREISELLVNGRGEIWVERGTGLTRTGRTFSSEEALRLYARRLLSARGRKVDQLSPFADCVTGEGNRVHVVIAPVSKQGTCLSIRKPRLEGWSLGALAGQGAMSPACEAYLRAAVLERKNLFVCGGTGTGKTSLLGALISEAPASERMLCLEDISEIRSTHPHLLQLEARPPNQEGEGEQSLRRLLQESLRMRPDRLIVGECRGAEALDLLMALNTGHAGSMGTIHANSARDALSRLELLALLGSGNLREGAVKSLIASAVQIVIFLEKGGGRRRIAGVAEVKGVDSGCYLLKEMKL